MAAGNAEKKTIFDRLENAWEVFRHGEKEKKEEVKSPEAFFPATAGSYRMLYTGSFNGEKNLGEAGPIKYYLMDYVALSLRSWQAYVESPQAQTVLNKFCTWVIGRGLKLQSEPNKEIIGKANPDFKEFSKQIEGRWNVYANSKHADLSGRRTLNQLARVAYKQAIIGGDCLVILRYIDGCVKIQVVDGAHLMSPLMGSEWYPMLLKNGNRVINGVEIDDDGQHIAYYVRKPFDSLNPINTLQLERVEATNRKSGFTVAFLVYGLEYRVDNHRGIPLLTAVIEKLKKLERYDEATLASAEEQAKIAYQVVHDMGSSGEFPFTHQMAQAHDTEITAADLPKTELGDELANKVMATTNKQAINNPPGAEVKTLSENKSQLYYKDFLEKNVDVICSCIEMPPNVAMSKYDSNYSASRAAIKDWEHTLSVKRSDFGIQFLQNVYNFFLEVEILTNRIQAPGYLIAKVKEDYMFIEAYRACRWVGAPVANIDPLKEVQAERMKLGITGEAIPLTNAEAATEILNGGDVAHNMEQYADELQTSKDLGIELPPEVQETATISDK